MYIVGTLKADMTAKIIYKKITTSASEFKKINLLILNKLIN